MVNSSGFGPEGPGLIPDAAKDPPSACGVCARKIRGSESHDVLRGRNWTPEIVKWASLLRSNAPFFYLNPIRGLAF